MDGIIKMYNEEKGFGFIRANDGDIFFHISDVKSDVHTIGKGMRVKFDIGRNEKGRKAINVDIINDSKFISIGNERIKMSNIKHYGISESQEDTRYKVCVYSLDEIKTRKDLFGTIHDLAEAGVIYKYKLTKTSEMVYVNYATRYNDGTWDCSLEEHPDFYIDEDKYADQVKQFEGSKSEADKRFVAGYRNKRKIIKHGASYGHVWATKCRFIDGDFSLHDEDFEKVEGAKEEYLYVTTYQNDNYTFYAADVDIRKSLETLDQYFGSLQ